MIDGRPLRVSRPTNRQTAYRAEPSVRQPQNEPEPTESPKRPAERREESESKKPRLRLSFDWIKWAAAILIIGIISLAGWLLWSSEPGIEHTIDSSKYQAVFLSGGEVYFGRLSVVNSDYMQLTDVYYLQRQHSDNDSTDENDGEALQVDNDSNVHQLLKYSDVAYGSEGTMVLLTSDIIRYENLRPDGVVARAIAERR